MTYSTLAIILLRCDFGEWDRLYTVYTREHGKCSLVGKGTRRPKAKLAAHLEPYSVVDLVIAKGRTIDRVTFARAIDHGAQLATNWERAQLAAFAAECVDQLTHEAHRDIAIFDLLSEYFRAIGDFLPLPIGGGARGGGGVPYDDADSLRTNFALRLLSILGYAPKLDLCLDCRGIGGPVPVIGIPERGGFVCHRCRPSAGTGIPLTREDCQRISDHSASFAPNAVPEPVTNYAFGLLNHHLVVPLRTMVSGISLTRSEAHATVMAS